MELIDTWNINRTAQSKNSNSVACIVEIISPWIRLKFWLKFCYNSVACIVDLIICPMYSYVLHYNIEKPGFNAVSAYLLLSHLPNYLLQLTVT